LDEKGKSFSSRDFAAFMEKEQSSGQHDLVFLIGGPYGFHATVYARAAMKLSFSSFTFPHQLIRLMLVEQLYRAYSIIKNEPYHHD
jgi:23S rRNA (pseudouridine1915-N3)-methyltransferase